MADDYENNAIVIDADNAARMRLKQAMSSVVTFDNIKLCTSLTDTLDFLELGSYWDVVFISNRFETDAIADFIRRGKDCPYSEDAAYVLVLKTDDQESNTVASTVLVGADGVLLEPFSVDKLVETTILAAKVKRERAEERQSAAFRFLLTDVMTHIDRLAGLLQCELNADVGMKRLQQLCSTFQTLDDESREAYFNVLCELFELAKVPPKPSYKGASARVAKRMHAKMMKEMEADMAGLEESLEDRLFKDIRKKK